MCIIVLYLICIWKLYYFHHRTLISLCRRPIGILKIDTNSSALWVNEVHDVCVCVLVHERVYIDVWEYDREREREQVQ